MKFSLQAVIAATLISSVLSQSTIAPRDSHAYVANAGWLNLRPSAEYGVVVGEHVLSGQAWSGNCGWISFGDGSPANGVAYSNTVTGDCGVNIDAAGNLSGYAYGANVGWIHFDWAAPTDARRARIARATGNFSGYAYGANIGWLSLCTGYLATAPEAGSLATFDVEVDGSRAGQSTGINSTPGGPSQGFTLSDGKLYFTANDATLGSVLRRVTGEGSEIVLSTSLPGADLNIGNLTDVNGTLYFTASNVWGNELWRLLPTGPEMVADVNPGIESSWPGNLTAVNGVLYFTATNPAAGSELWRVTGGGLPVVTDLAPGVDGSSPGNLKGVGNRLFFTASTTAAGEELWYLDATYAAVLVENDAVADGGIRSGADGIFPGNTLVQGETLYAVLGTTPFGAGDREVWRVRTSVGRVFQAELVFTSTAPPGPFSFGPPVEFAAVGTELFFTASSPATGAEIWRVTTPTAAAVLLADVVVGANGSFPQNLLNVNGVLYFTADDGVNGNELWRQTPTGAEMVEDVIPGGGINPADSSYPSQLTMAGGKLYFVADDGVQGNQLWSLGTSGNAIRLGGPVNFLQSLMTVNDRIYFVAGGINGDMLFTLNSLDVPMPVATDGLAPNPAYLTDYQGQLIWQTNDGVRGLGLWRIGQTVPALTLLEDAPATISGFLGNAGGGAGFTIATSWRGGTPMTDLTPFGSVTFHASTGTWTWSKPSVAPADSGLVTITASDASGNCSAGSFQLVVQPRLPEIVVEHPPATVLETDVSSLHFGTAGQGFLLAKDFTVRNTGTRQLSIPAVNLAGEFALIGSAPSPASPWIIPAGDSRVMTVSMIPGNNGAKSGSVSLVNDDPDESPFVILLTGVIQAPKLALFGVTGVPEISDGQAVPVDFGRAGTVPLVKRFRAMNVGQQTLEITAASLPPGFTLLTPALPVTLPVGGSQLVQVRYVPSGSGTVPGNVNFTTNDLGNPQFTFPVQVVVGPPCNDLSFAAETVPLPLFPYLSSGAVMGDVTGDGHQDILTIQEVSDETPTFADNTKLMVLAGDGVGHFNFEGQVMTVPTNSEIMHLADFNRDGRMDLVLTPYQHSAYVSVLLQRTETGTAAPGPRFGIYGGSGVTQLGLSSHVAVADFDRDGMADIMIANATSHLMGLVRGNGNGSFSYLQPENQITTPKYPTVLMAEDFNLDGMPDLGMVCRIGGTEDFPPAPAAGVYQNGKIFNYQGNGAGNFTSGAPNTVGPWATAMTTADFNSDGFPDMVTGSLEGIISVRLGTGTGTFTNAADILVPNAATSAIGELQTGDFNGDGAPDFLSLSFRYFPDGAVFPHVGVHLSNGDGTFTLGKWITAERYASHLAVGDFDHDGVSDFVLVAEHLWLYRNFSCHPSIIRVTHRDPLADGVSSVSLGSTAVDTSVFTYFTIFNDGKHELTGITATIDGQADSTFRVSIQPIPDNVPGKFELPNPQFTQVKIGFRPRSAGPKTAVLHITSNDPDNNLFDIILTGTGTQNYTGWTGEYLLEGPAATPSANPTGDGVNNLMKYAFNLSPLTAGSPELIPGTGLSGLPRISTALSGPGTVFRYEYIRRRGGGLVYRGCPENPGFSSSRGML